MARMGPYTELLPFQPTPLSLLLLMQVQKLKKSNSLVPNKEGLMQKLS
jgi:hypothetical protein